MYNLLFLSEKIQKYRKCPALWQFWTGMGKNRFSSRFKWKCVELEVEHFSPSVPDAHYSERQDKPFSLQIQQLEVDLKLNCRFYFFAPRDLMG